MDIVPEEPAIVVEGLSVRYGPHRVLDEVSLRVPRGSVYALLGRNGEGKTSLVRCLLGLQRPASGRLRVLGLDPWTRRPEAMTRIGVVPEEPDAPPELSPARLSALCARLTPRWDGLRVSERLARFGVPVDTPFDRLSKGQKAAVMLSLSLGHGPELLVLDDPTLGLDVVARHAVLGEVIGELADRGTTVFLTTHDLAGVEGLAERVAILVNGRVKVEDSMETLKERWARPLEDVFEAVTTGDRSVA